MESNQTRTVYVPVVVYVPVNDANNGSSSTTSTIGENEFKSLINSNTPIISKLDPENVVSTVFNRHKSPKLKKITTHIKHDKRSADPYPTHITVHSHSRLKSTNQNIDFHTTSSITISPKSRAIKKTKFKKRQSNYYPSAYISNPCDQLFGPGTLDCSANSTNTESEADTSINNALNKSSHQQTVTQIVDNESHEKNSKAKNDFAYIPTPRWTKTQNVMLEEFYKKTRFPKPNEIKAFALKLNVMDCDVDEWFRKRRGRDRKTKRKNENLQNLIDNYLDA